MDVQRVQRDIRGAIEHFPNLETHTTLGGDIYIKGALQTSVGQIYVISVTFVGYPAQMPKVTVIAPAITHTKHMYNTGHICYMHPNFWNPARHDLKFVLAQIAVWLNKHEIYKQKLVWPGPGMTH